MEKVGLGLLGIGILFLGIVVFWFTGVPPQHEDAAPATGCEDPKNFQATDPIAEAEIVEVVSPVNPFMDDTTVGELQSVAIDEEREKRDFISESQPPGIREALTAILESDVGYLLDLNALRDIASRSQHIESDRANETAALTLIAPNLHITEYERRLDVIVHRSDEQLDDLLESYLGREWPGLAVWRKAKLAELRRKGG